LPDLYSPKHAINGYRAWDLSLAWAVSAWVAESDRATQIPHLILPHAEASLAVYQSGDSMGIVVCGPGREPREHYPTPGTRLIGISLSPEIMANCLGLHPAEWENTVEQAPPDLLWKLEPALEKMRTLPSWQALLIWIESVQSIISSDPLTLFEEHYLAARIRAHHGKLRVSNLASQFSCSERQLRRRFIDLIGLSPKALARQLRLSHIIARADKSQCPNWAALAFDAGYCDQAHFNRECRALTGHTPKQIHHSRLALSEKSNTAALAC
jgi:AraC-like DNA-binding protein